MARWVVRLAGVLMSWLGAACGPTPDIACGVPGVSVACTCDDGATGASRCLEDGGVGRCLCSPSAVSLDGGPQAGEVAGGGAGGKAAGSDAAATDAADPRDAQKPGEDAGKASAAPYAACSSSRECPPESGCRPLSFGGLGAGYCEASCERNTDCPEPSSGRALAVCSAGACRLDCRGGRACPQGMACLQLVVATGPEQTCSWR